jgi:molybdopterin-synthase adenylyltransferase
MNKGNLTLNENERTRYLRQMAMDGFGEEGQVALKKSTVAVMGVGGLGSPASMYLAAAGVGKILLIDYQSPDLTNLNRQVLHWERDVENSTSKAFSAANKLHQLNSEIEIIPKVARIGVGELSDIVGQGTVVLDCLDNFDARKELNAYCCREGIPFVHAAVEGFSGQLTVIVPGQTPCLDCIFPVAPVKRQTIPIIGFTAGVFGCMEAAEAVKLITGIGRPLTGKLLVGDLSMNYWETIEIARNGQCPTCIGH